jgi:uncharacterized protein (TIGR00369 family)
MIPAGYARHTRSSPLTEPWEPLYARESDDGHLHLAVELREAHCNSRGFAHGGLVSALADNAMGLSVARRVQAAGGTPKAGAVTVSLALDFLDSARPGEWLEFLPTVLKLGGSLAFVECRVACGDRLVARGNATFRLLA